MTAPINIGPAAKKAPFTPPSPAKPASHIGMPLPTGRMMPKVQLSETELADMMKVPGWREGDPIPEGMADALAKVRAEIEATPIAPPVPLDTPPVMPSGYVDVATLPKERQAEYEELGQFLAAAREANVRVANEERMSVPGAGPGINDAILGNTTIEIDLEDDVAEPAPEPKRSKTADLLGLNAMEITHCPHCHWQLSDPDVEDPTPAERQRYLQAVLGLKPFDQIITLYGGAVEATFRELRPGELDAVFMAAFARQAEDPENDARAQTFAEWVDRYRLSLQLTHLRLGEQPMVLPKDLDGWKTDASVSDVDAVRAAADSVFSSVVNTESLGRAMMAALGRFCRLVAKLEVSADRPDFWGAAPST